MTLDYALLTDRDDVVGYLRATGLLDALVENGSEAHVEVREVTAGNMNRVFIARGPLGSLAVKQAPPFVQAAGPEWPIDPARIGAEARAYEVLGRLVPDAVPAIVHVDLDRFVMVMEDLSALEVLRDELVRQVQDATAGRPVAYLDYGGIGDVVGRFVGELSRATSIQLLGAAEHADLVRESTNAALCQLTLDVVLDEPFRAHEHNHWHPALGERIAALYADRDVLAAVAGVRETFVSSRQALLHGDLHSGSVMIGRADDGGQKVTVFDPEFSFVGPIGLDLGLFWANIAIAGVAARAAGHDGLAAAREDAIDASWQAFVRAWDDDDSIDIDDDFFEGVRSDAWRFAGVEAMRRVAGWSHAADLETLPDEAAAEAQLAVFDLARHWIVTGTEAPLENAPPHPTGDTP
ncbi:phosphotransferase [Agreia sp. COWG]|uniref:phosphotransferase n=1 Tax=Agreia sp. COWG TaxID=2773266 RepID=UPI0019255787|nr:phosphotransferase [Agreia sp. COWG]CAD6006274.1 S-methyl-5-thioribose kinase [Agreia sp. COWG]